MPSDAEAVKALIAAKANVNAKAKGGATPLMMAKVFNRTEIVAIPVKGRRQGKLKPSFLLVRGRLARSSLQGEDAGETPAHPEQEDLSHFRAAMEARLAPGRPR